MAGKYDIFRTLPDGNPLWIEVVDGLEEAKLQLFRLASDVPGDYFIYNSQTGSIIPHVHLQPLDCSPEA